MVRVCVCPMGRRVRAVTTKPCIRKFNYSCGNINNPPTPVCNVGLSTTSTSYYQISDSPQVTHQSSTVTNGWVMPLSSSQNYESRKWKMSLVPQVSASPGLISRDRRTYSRTPLFSLRHNPTTIYYHNWIFEHLLLRKVSHLISWKRLIFGEPEVKPLRNWRNNKMIFKTVPEGLDTR
jgi:hypothetical protein